MRLKYSITCAIKFNNNIQFDVYSVIYINNRIFISRNDLYVKTNFKSKSNLFVICIIFIVSYFDL